jgi:hypothetical protein
MKKRVSFFIIILILTAAFLALPDISFAARDISIINYYYATHWTPKETVTFTITLKNNESTAQTAYALFALTKQGNEPSTELYTPSTGSISSGGSATVTVNWTAAVGLYTVTIKAYDSDDKVTQTIYAPLPVHVGQTTDSVAAFPKVLDLGTLQYGRFMHPVPAEISWDFYERSSQIRKDQPWYMRIYTDNHKRYKGIDDAIYSGRVATQGSGGADAMGSPAGLVSSDGKYAIPLKVWCLNYGPDVEEGWDPTLMGPPPVKEDYYWKGPLLDNQKRDASRVAWEWIPDYIDMTADNNTWRKLIGQDPYDTHYVSDANPTGDFTLASPFQIFLAYETSPTAVEGKYWTDLIIEIYSP